MDSNISNDDLDRFSSMDYNSDYYDEFEYEDNGDMIIDPNMQINDSLSSSDSEFEEIESTYDHMITPTHSYLGDSMEEVRGPVLFDDFAIIEDFPLIIERDSFIHPGQLFPMVVNFSSTKEVLRKCKANKLSVFGIIFVVGHPHRRISQCGVVAEILEFFDNGHVLRLKARGRQRFKLLKSIQKIDDTETYYEKIQILPEIKAKASLDSSKLAVLDNQRTVVKNDTISKNKIRKLERYDASITAWPAWVHNCADPWLLTKKIKKYLEPWQNRVTIPDDPNELSYWLGRNLPIKDSIRDKLLSMTNATSRLYYYDKFLSKKRVIVCALCKNFVSKVKYMFPMTPEGLQSLYTNPGGNIFEAITLTKVSNFKFGISLPSSDYSWFPGYSWTPIYCNTCNKHSGWMFTATTLGLKPSIFYALIGKLVRLADQKRKT